MIAFTGELFLYEGGKWFFVSVPEELSDDLRERYEGRTAGFGSIPVEATLGPSTWTTSLFPARTGCYLLPVKKPVRRAADVDDGDVVEVTLRVLLD